MNSIVEDMLSEKEALADEVLGSVIGEEKEVREGKVPLDSDSEEKKIQQLTESDSDLMHICNSQCGWAVAEQLKSILANASPKGIDAANLNSRAVQLIYRLVKNRTDEESNDVRDAIEGWVGEGLGDPEVLGTQDPKPKRW